MSDDTKLDQQARDRDADSAYEEGVRDAAWWADHQATADEVRRLAAWRDACGTNWAEVFEPDAASAYAACEHFYFAIDPAEDGDRAAADAFWGLLLGDDFRRKVSDPAYVKGFAEEALDRWSDRVGGR